MQLLRTLRDGLRWWMAPALVVLLAGLIALIALTGVSTLSAVHYTAL